jgi:cyclopropane fatty-acyl-phospholipid synthase-like methyltransferase
MEVQGQHPPFDSIGQRYDEVFVDRSEQQRAGAWALERLEPGSRVLDYGCGSGLPTALQFTDAGMRVVGVDESQRMLALARESVPAAQFVHQDMRTLDGLGEFDAVVAFFSLLMLSRSEITVALRDLHSRLVGPRLLALSMVQGDFDSLPISFLGTPLRTTAYPREQLVEVVGEAGFRVEEVRETEIELEPLRVERQLFLCAVAENVRADA